MDRALLGVFYLTAAFTGIVGGSSLLGGKRTWQAIAGISIGLLALVDALNWQAVNGVLDADATKRAWEAMRAAGNSTYIAPRPIPIPFVLWLIDVIGVVSLFVATAFAANDQSESRVLVRGALITSALAFVAMAVYWLLLLAGPFPTFREAILGARGRNPGSWKPYATSSLCLLPTIGCYFGWRRTCEPGAKAPVLDSIPRRRAWQWLAGTNGVAALFYAISLALR